MSEHKTVAALRQALPYLRLYRGQTFVVKVAGEAVEAREDALRLLEQISVLHQVGIRVVLVHGGGKQASALAEKLGEASAFVDGRRVTDRGMLDSMIMALNGTARTAVLAACREQMIPAVGLSGVDAGIIAADRRSPTKSKSGEPVDYGLVGDIASVNVRPLLGLLEDGYLPVLSPLACDDGGQVLNVNADSAAAAVAVALGAAKLILVTRERGILRDPADRHSLISHIELAELENLEASGALKDGMLPKVSCVRTALTGGVERVHIVSYAYPDSLLIEVFTNEGCGTLIVREDPAAS